MTQHYVGTKIIEAWPSEKVSTRICGLDCKPGSAECTGYCEDSTIASPGTLPPQAGYTVKYPDGYTSWSPKDVFESAYLPLGHIGHLPPHVQRMVAELEQLDDRIKKLGTFQGSDLYASLSEDERKDLDTQAKCMVAYWNALLIRVERARGQFERPALTDADASADIAGTARPDNPGLNTNAA